MVTDSFIACGGRVCVKVEWCLLWCFKVDQGVRQGRILSTDLNKLYDNGLFDRLQLTGVGCHIGEISCVVPGCADDSAVLEENERII